MGMGMELRASSRADRRRGPPGSPDGGSGRWAARSGIRAGVRVTVSHAAPRPGTWTLTQSLPVSQGSYPPFSGGLWFGVGEVGRDGVCV